MAEDAGLKALSQQLTRSLRPDQSPAALSRLVDEQLLSPAAAQRERTAAALLADEPLAAALAWRAYAGVGRAHDAADRAAPGGPEDPVCRWLASWHAAGPATEQRRFALRLFPALAWTVCFSAAAYDDTPPGAEAVLLCAHNDEARARGGRPLELTVPGDAAASAQARPTSPAPALTTSNLGQHNVLGPKRVRVAEPISELDCINESSWPIVLQTVLSQCNTVLADQSLQARLLYCRVVSRMASLGQQYDTSKERFPGVAPEVQHLLHIPDSTLPVVRRLQLPRELLCEALRGVSCCLYRKETRGAAEDACRCVERYAICFYEPLVLATARALLNLSKTFAEGHVPLPLPVNGVQQLKPLVYITEEKDKAEKDKPQPKPQMKVQESDASSSSEPESSDESSTDDEDYD